MQVPQGKDPSGLSQGLGLWSLFAWERDSLGRRSYLVGGAPMAMGKERASNLAR
jgi:hypothetical protein